MAKTTNKNTGMGLVSQADEPLEVPPRTSPEALQAAERIEKARRARQDERPVCPEHGVQMIAYSTNAMLTYYRCPHWPECRRTDKRVRPIGPLKNLYGHGKSGQTEASENG